MVITRSALAVESKPTIDEPQCKKARTRYGVASGSDTQIFELEQRGHEIEKIHTYFLDKSKEAPVGGGTHWLKRERVEFVKDETVHVFYKNTGLTPSKILQFVLTSEPDSGLLGHSTTSLSALVAPLIEGHKINEYLVSIQCLQKIQHFEA